MIKMNAETRQRFESVLAGTADQLEAQVDELARLAAEVFKKDTAGKTQMSNLERIGLTSRRLGDVVAYVMRQTGRDKRWSGPLQGKACLGQRLVEFLERLKATADGACEKAGLGEHRNELRLRLAGLCLRNLNSAFLYRNALERG